MHNLLTEPVIRFNHSNNGIVQASLPEVYTALMSDEVDAFPALRPHQRHAWHAFLVQLGVISMQKAGLTEPPEDADEWHRIIRCLTKDEFPDDEPWSLVVDDITKPAFMQPPASSSAKLAEYLYKPKKGKYEAKNGEKKPITTPDSLDMLVTSKNHDLKSAIAAHADPDDWIFALISLQTMEGYGGKFNYGISRMPSGYGNRPAFSLTPSARPGSHFRHDLIELLKHRQTILDEYPMFDSGIGLLWTVPWDGTKAQKKLISELGPFYIEVCRRIRLRLSINKLIAVRANSDDRRIEDAKGLTGDPWMPVSNNTNPKGTPPAFLTQRRFGYERVVDGLFSGDWKQPLLLSRMSSVSSDSQDMHLVARGMVRGEGGTAGYHERIVTFRRQSIQIFGRPGGQALLSDIARERIEQIGKTKDALRYAIAVFLANGETDRKNIKPENWELATPKSNNLDEIVDARFFKDLQDEFQVADPEERERIRNRWLRIIVAKAEGVLNDAIQSLPCPYSRRHKCLVRAEGVFRGRILGPNGFLDLYRKPE